MKKRSFSLISSVIVTLVIFMLLSAPVFARDKYIPDVKVHTLSNGLIIMVVERHGAPTIACYRYHKVGSVNEHPGITGAAHLLEHMMFKGTRKIGTWNYEAEVPIMKKIDYLVDQIEKELAKGVNDYRKVDQRKIDRLWGEVRKLQAEQRKYIRKNEIDYLYKTEGARGLNASTSYDRTDYYVKLPAGKLKLWAFIESERLKDPVFREFYSERDVVYEELRMGDNSPGGVLFDALFSNFFVTSPYGHPIVGWKSDVETMRREQIKDFFLKYYAPNNTVLVLVGDVDYKEAVNTVEEYFGDIPRQEDPRPVFTREPEQKGERRVKVQFDATPRMLIGFHGPPPGHPDQYALDILANILSSGRTSRFRKNLIKPGIAYTCNSMNWTFGYVNTFIIEGKPEGSHTLEELEKAIYEQIDNLKKEPVTERELEKVKNKMMKEFIDKLQNDMLLANSLAMNLVWTGDWRNFDEREKYKAVTANDIMRVARKYLVKKNRTVAYLIPPEDEAHKQEKKVKEEQQ